MRTQHTFEHPGPGYSIGIGRNGVEWRWSWLPPADDSKLSTPDFTGADEGDLRVIRDALTSWLGDEICAACAHGDHSRHRDHGRSGAGCYGYIEKMCPCSVRPEGAIAMDESWIAERVHQETTPQEGTRDREPLCAILTGIVDAPMTYNEDEVTCDACKAINMAMDRGKVVQIGVGKP